MTYQIQTPNKQQRCKILTQIYWTVKPSALSVSLGSQDSQNRVERICFRCHQTFTFSLPCLETASRCLRAWWSWFGSSEFLPRHTWLSLEDCAVSLANLSFVEHFSLIVTFLLNLDCGRNSKRQSGNYSRWASTFSLQLLPRNSRKCPALPFLDENSLSSLST